MKSLFLIAIVIFGLVMMGNPADGGPVTLSACCVAACAIEIPPVDGGVATGALIATCSGVCISSLGAIVGYAGPACVWASVLGP